MTVLEKDFSTVAGIVAHYQARPVPEGAVLLSNLGTAMYTKPGFLPSDLESLLLRYEQQRGLFIGPPQGGDAMSRMFQENFTAFVNKMMGACGHKPIVLDFLPTDQLVAEGSLGLYKVPERPCP